MAEMTEYARKSRPVSQRYEAYEKRMQRIGRVIGWFGKHKIISLVLLVAIIGGIIGILSIRGSFIGEFSCMDYTYGDQPQITCYAFLCRPCYEYSDSSANGNWSADIPAVPGVYHIRAYTKDGFGNVRYTDTRTFTIYPRPLSIDIEDSTYVYGDMDEDFLASKTKVTGLAQSDSIVDVQYEFREGDARSYSAAISDFCVVNSSGQDVKNCYEISLSGGSFTMTPRPVTIATEDAEKIYDGEGWIGSGVSIKKGSLAASDYLSSNVFPLPADAGTYVIGAEVSILDENGVDVTQCYALSFDFGQLTVQPRKMVISSESAEKIYDEKPLTEPEWSILSGDVVSGHTLNVAVEGTQTAAGRGVNFFTVSILDGSGKDVTGNYQLDLQYGTLIVNPIVLKVKSDSAEKVYDGTPLSGSAKLVEGSLLKGHKLSISKEYEVVNAGSYINIPDVVITNKKGVDVTNEGYKIEFEYGTLLITPRPITVTSASASRLYDGYPLIHHDYSVTSGSFGKQGGKEAVSVANFTGSQTEVGSSENTFGIFIGSVSGFDTTANYDITYVFGTLTVLENPDYKDPNEGDSQEDPSMDESSKIRFPEGGSSGTKTYAYVTGLKGFSKKTPLYLRTQSFGDYNMVEWIAADPNDMFWDYNSRLTEIGRILEQLGQKSASIRVERLKGCPIILPYFTSDPNQIFSNGNDCYFLASPKEFDITCYPGLNYRDIMGLKLQATDPYLEEEYRKYVYDNYLSVPSSTSYELLQWASKNGIHMDSPTLVKDIQAAVLKAGVYNMHADQYPANVDVVVYFLTEAKEGICQHFASAATLLYRCFGIPARYTVGFATEVRNNQTSVVTDIDAHAWVEIYVDGVGWIPIEVTPGGGTGNGDDPILGPGADDLIIGCYSAVKYYDGKPFDLSEHNAYTVMSGIIPSGYRLDITFKSVSKYTEPGTYELEVQEYAIYDKNGKDVTDMYASITIKPGLITILKRKITVTIGSARKEYDGLPLTCLNYWVSQGSLVMGDELSVELLKSITQPGCIENAVGEVKIVNYNSKKAKDVTDFYDIEIIPGYLEIVKAP